ncbi:MAG TPA: hypothetical protein DHW02_16890 [Ktedonobacter sp.]|nr:hypothetical protein [Ktedonobacter sp.]
MDRVKITTELELESPVDSSAISIQVNINGENLPEILNVEEFFALKEHDGLVPLFTCVCGDFGCGGYYVDVACTDTDLILRNSYHRFNRSLQSTFEYHLDWQQVKGVAEEIIAYLQKIQELNPQAFVTNGYVGGNLLARLPDYRKSSLLVP